MGGGKGGAKGSGGGKKTEQPQSNGTKPEQQQQQNTGSSSQKELKLLLLGSGESGKCFGRGTPIMKFDGSLVAVENVKVGDNLMGDDATVRCVQEVHSGIGQLYKIYVENGEPVIVNGQHILCLKFRQEEAVFYEDDSRKWTVEYTEYNNAKLQRISQHFFVQDYLTTSTSGREEEEEEEEEQQGDLCEADAKMKAERAAREFLEQKIPNRLCYGSIVEISVLDYLSLQAEEQKMLLWYRNGVEYSSAAAAAVTTAVAESFPMDPHSFGLLLCCQSEAAATISTTTGGGVGSGDVNGKIPEIYKFSSKECRRNLLCGIVDGLKGTMIDAERKEIEIRIPRKNAALRCFPNSRSLEEQDLHDEVVHLIRSVGYEVCYNDTSSCEGIIRFRIIAEEEEEATANINTCGKFGHYGLLHRVSEIRIEVDRVADFYGFEVDGNHRFLLGDFSVVHNSTFFKQVKSIHEGDKYTSEEIAAYKSSIYANVLQTIKVLSDACLKNKDPPFEKSENKAKAEKMIKAAANDSTLLINAAEIYTPDVHKMVGELWKDANIQELFQNHRYEYHIFDGAQYFFDNFDKLLPPNYVPNADDILRCRRKTTGLIQTQFEYKGIKFSLHDVGGQRSERKKWSNCSEGVSALLYVCCASEYDQKCYEDDVTNRMLESMDLFSETINGNYFKDKTIIVFLNKMDVFKAKMAVKDLSCTFPEYTGGPDVEKGIEFLKQQYRDHDKSKKERLHFFVTQATSKESVKATFDEVKDFLVQEFTSTTTAQGQ